MTQDLFNDVKNEVRKICANLGYYCEFNCKTGFFKVFSKLDSDGKSRLTAILLESVSSVTGASLVSVAIDDYGKLYALFTINEFTDGNRD